MLRHVLSVAVLLALAAPALGQAPVDSVPPRPAFSVPVTGDFQPPQTSALRAYAYSVAATAVPIAAGALLLRVSEPADTAGEVTPGDVGIMLVFAGVMAGPTAGNLSLGAGADARRGVFMSGGGFVAGVALAGGGVAVAGFCLAGDLVRGELGSGDCVAGPLAVVLLVGGAAAAAAGTLAGTVYHFVTIPRNAARARRYRQVHPRVAVAPGWRSGGPSVSVRVGL